MSRKKNWRMIVGGVIFLAGAVAFFFGMLGDAPRSNDPSGLMELVGQVSGVIGMIGLALVVAGLLGWQGFSKK